MKKQYILPVVALCATLTSCFKDEPLNAECDIEQAYVHTNDPAEIFFSANDTLVYVPSEATEVVFNIKEGSDVSAMAPIFTITEGATISPASGTTFDFSDGRKVAYTVTSEDGSWQRTYNVSFNTQSTIGNFDFENFRLIDGAAGGQYYEWSDIDEGGAWAGNWATGNPGFNISMSTAAPEDYPTTPVADGYYGSAAKLVTRSTGALGQLVNMGIAAGNLFLGRFDVSKALTNTLQATCFGLPFNREPRQFTGWYKYRPGETYIDRSGNPVAGKTDAGNIYAVFYRNEDDKGNPFVLHGDDVLTSPQIMAIAKLPEVETTDEWTQFAIDFEYQKEIDPGVLANRGYSLAVVFTSSADGASFCGAIGSTLYVDEVKVICAETSE